MSSFNFRKSLSCGEGKRVNVGKNGISYTETHDFGSYKLTYTYKTNGDVLLTYSIKETGMSYTEKIPKED